MLGGKAIPEVANLRDHFPPRVRGICREWHWESRFLWRDDGALNPAGFLSTELYCGVGGPFQGSLPRSRHRKSISQAVRCDAKGAVVVGARVFSPAHLDSVHANGGRRERTSCAHPPGLPLVEAS
jgi:hypothetical protein